MVYAITLFIAVLALCYVAFSFFKLKSLPEGTERMSDMAGVIRSGAKTFMKAEYKDA